MAYTREQIIQAVTVIRDTCEEHDDCSECPFSNGGDCLVSSAETSPEEWAINGLKSWKAILV